MKTVTLEDLEEGFLVESTADAGHLASQMQRWELVKNHDNRGQTTFTPTLEDDRSIKRITLD